MRVAVLGCGPTGLVAAHAALAAGAEVEVYSRKRKSHMFGAQYLHAPIPGISHDWPHTIRYQLLGQPDEYRRKVYGMHGIDVEVSPDSLTSEHEAWDIRYAYDRLWAFWESQVTDMALIPGNLNALLGRIDLTYVFNSIPARVLCRNSEHYFHGTDVWAMGETTDVSIELGDRDIPADTVVCSGLPEHDWYRVSNLYGYKTIEWPYKLASPKPHRGPVVAALVRKPIAHTCTCFDGTKLVPVGRYGRWKKGVLVNHVFEQVLGMIQGATA